MNSIVRAWKKRQQQPKYKGPDTVVVDGESLVLRENEIRREKKMASTKGVKVGVNRPVVTELALYGPQERVESLFRETARTLGRLGIGTKGAKSLGHPRRSVGGSPNLHDVIRWLDDIENTAEYRMDVKFLKRLHLTARQRVRPEVLAKIEGK